MNIKINSVRFSASSRLEDFVSTKVQKLAQYYESIIGAEVFLRLENTQTSENKIAEIKIEIPGSELFAKKQCKTFEESTDTACEALIRQITRHKQKVKEYKNR